MSRRLVSHSYHLMVSRLKPCRIHLHVRLALTEKKGHCINAHNLIHWKREHWQLDMKPDYSSFTVVYWRGSFTPGRKLNTVCPSEMFADVAAFLLWAFFFPSTAPVSSDSENFHPLFWMNPSELFSAASNSLTTARCCLPKAMKSYGPVVGRGAHHLTALRNDCTITITSSGSIRWL